MAAPTNAAKREESPCQPGAVHTWLHRPMLQNVKKVLANPEPSTHDPGCVKTPTTNFRVERLSRLGRIRKEQLCQSLSKEEKRENNSAHSPRMHVFTQSGPGTDLNCHEACISRGA